MANERLRQALHRAGLDVEELAEKAEVDAKTVGRWLGGRVPRPRSRAKVAQALGVEEIDLWPDIAAPSLTRDHGRELAGVYASASDIRAPHWRELMQTAREHIDLLDYTLHDILTAPGTIDLLREKADAGCHVRILIAHPKSIWVTSLSQQLGEDQPDEHGNTALDLEIQQSLDQLKPLAGHPGIELYTHWAERANSILRFDDQMLVTLHLYATPDSQAPVLHIHRRGDNGLFDQFADHLDVIREQASDPIPRITPT